MKTSPHGLKKSPKSKMESRGDADYISTKNNTRAISEHNEENSTIRKNKVLWPDNPMKPKPKEKKEGKIIDWLRE
jgi:hypothetical protein